MTEMTVKENVLPELADLNELANGLGGLIQVRESLLKPFIIKLAQAMSRSVVSETARIGDFVSESKGVNFGKELKFIPIMVRESASLMYSATNPPRIMSLDHGLKDGSPICFTKDLIKNKDGILCKNCPYGENWNTWEYEGQKHTPKCKTSIDVVCIPEGHNEIALLQFRKTSYKAGKDLVNKIVSGGGAPFLFKYNLKTKDEINQADQRYKVIDPMATTATRLTNDELIAYSDTIKNFLKAQKNNSVDYDVTDSEELDKSIEELPV